MLTSSNIRPSLHVIHVLLIDSFFAQRGYFFPREQNIRIHRMRVEMIFMGLPAVRQALPLPSRDSLSRARSFLRPLLPSVCYAGYWQPRKRCMKKWIHIFSASIVIIPNRLLCQMQANCSGTEFLLTISKFMKRISFAIACLHPSQNVKSGIFTGIRAVDGKEMYKKAWCTCNVVVLPCQAITNLTFSSSPHLKLPIIYDKLWSVKNRIFSGQLLLIASQKFFRRIGSSFVSG